MEHPGYGAGKICGGLSLFDADKVTIDDSLFANAKGDGHFSITHSENNLYLQFSHVTTTPFTIGRAWGTFLRIPKADVLAKSSGGVPPYTLLSVTSRDQDFVQISGDYILFAPYGNTNSILDYTMEDSATPTKAMASSTITVIVTNAVGSVRSVTTSGDSVTIAFAGIPGYSYAVERSSSVSDWSGATTVQTTNTPSAGVWTFSETPPSSPAYYRLRQNNN